MTKRGAGTETGERLSEEKGPAVVVALQNRGDGRSVGSGVSGRVIVRPPHCVTATPVHIFVHCIFII